MCPARSPTTRVLRNCEGRSKASSRKWNDRPRFLISDRALSRRPGIGFLPPCGPCTISRVVWSIYLFARFGPVLGPGCSIWFAAAPHFVAVPLLCAALFIFVFSNFLRPIRFSILSFDYLCLPVPYTCLLGLVPCWVVGARCGSLRRRISLRRRCFARPCVFGVCGP